MYQNDLILRAAKGEQVERVPIWLMRQAGRILPEYKATRARAKNFIEFVKNPELAAEVTIQPVDILGVDAAIIFSDILVIPEAMGLPYQMIEAKGPNFEKTIKSQKDIDDLHIADAGDLDYVIQAIPAQGPGPDPGDKHRDDAGERQSHSNPPRPPILPGPHPSSRCLSPG